MFWIAIFRPAFLLALVRASFDGRAGAHVPDLHDCAVHPLRGDRDAKPPRRPARPGQVRLRHPPGRLVLDRGTDLVPALRGDALGPG